MVSLCRHRTNVRAMFLRELFPKTLCRQVLLEERVSQQHVKQRRHILHRHAQLDERAQSTIEAAFVAPVLLGCILMLVQPCIVLYDRIIMQEAAAEACRLASTLSSSTTADLVDGLVHRRLAAIPQQDNFHIHGGGCSYSVEVKGNETSEQVSVKVTNKLKPLPLIDFMCKSVGATDGDGCWDVSVEASAPTQPDWVPNSPSGRKPSGWVGDWL